MDLRPKSSVFEYISPLLKQLLKTAKQEPKLDIINQSLVGLFVALCKYQSNERDVERRKFLEMVMDKKDLVRHDEEFLLEMMKN